MWADWNAPEYSSPAGVSTRLPLPHFRHQDLVETQLKPGWNLVENMIKFHGHGRNESIRGSRVAIKIMTQAVLSRQLLRYCRNWRHLDRVRLIRRKKIATKRQICCFVASVGAFSSWYFTFSLHLCLSSMSHATFHLKHKVKMQDVDDQTQTL